jgi:thymidylate synthase
MLTASNTNHLNYAMSTSHTTPIKSHGRSCLSTTPTQITSIPPCADLPLDLTLRASHSDHEELQYLNLIQLIISNGEERKDRTGTGTLSVFGPPQLRFSLARDNLPLLTTKRVFYRGLLEELLWFIKGDTNAATLQKKGVKIWDGNASREYLDRIGLYNRREGDLGPVYGFQWRHFGAEYVDCDTDYTGQGVDQLKEVVDKICNKPHDRRIIISAWNPKGKKWRRKNM